MKVAIFDLDGTVRRSKTGTFVKDHNDQELIPGIKERMEALREMDYNLIVWTNQGGVAHGHKAELDFYVEKNGIESMLGFNMNMWIVSFLMPDARVKRYKGNSFIRKPSLGGFAVIEDFATKMMEQVNWDESFMVGDMDTDKECAEMGGIKYFDINDFLNVGIEELHGKI